MTGYRGRFSIVEVLTMNAELEHLIGKGTTADQLTEAATAGGMRSLWDSGLRHVLAGDSTVEELLRVTDPPQAQDRAGAATWRPAGAGQAAASPVASRSSPASVPPPPSQPGASLDFMTEMELVDRVDWASTGGGAVLELLEGKELPGVVAIPEN